MNNFNAGALEGIKMILPILLGIIPFALIVGVTGVNNGLSSPEVIAMSPEVNSKGYNYAEAVNMDVCTGCMNCAVVCPDPE